MNDHVNLLPTSVRRRNLFWLRVRQWGLCWTLASGICLIGILAQSVRVTMQHAQLVDLHNTGKPLREAEQQLREIQQKLDAFTGRESLLAMLDRIDQPVQVLGIVGRSTGGPKQDVQVFDMMLSPTQVTEVIESLDAAGKAVKTTKLHDRVQLKIDALGVDDLAVARFVAGLREAGVFESVSLKQSVRATGLPGESRRFAVECVYQ